MQPCSKDTVASLEARATEIESLFIEHDLSTADVAKALGISYCTLWSAVDQSLILQDAKNNALTLVSECLKKRTIGAGLGKLKLGPGELGALAWAGKNFAGLSDRQVSEQTVRVEYQGAPREEERSTFVPNVVTLPTHVNSNLQRGATQGEDGDQGSSSAERSVANEGTDGSPK